MTSSSPAMEPFTLIEETDQFPARPFLFNKLVTLTSAANADHDIQYLNTLRRDYPFHIITTIPEASVPLRAFAAAGNAKCELDTEGDSLATWRGFVPPAQRNGKGGLGEIVLFARYKYQWMNEDFIFYLINNVQYVIKAQQLDEHTRGPSKITDALILAVGEWKMPDDKVVWVFDRFWTADRKLWQEVQKANWSKVILDETLKTDLTSVTEIFFSSKEVYEDLGVPWKRGVMFYGPPGNGKTVSIKALMHTLLNREDPIPTLYVKSAPTTFTIQLVFAKARAMSPCMLILEDIETIVTPTTRSYFFNELDGLAGNDGLFVVASTNYLERLDPGLTQRPSRFDRKYLFPLPDEESRVKYCEFWRAKLAKNKKVDFPKKLCGAMARFTYDFSFAFLQECFVASLLELARDSSQGSNLHWESSDDGDEDDLDDYPLWVVFKKQAVILRQQIHPEEPGEGMTASHAAIVEESSNALSRPGTKDELLPILPVRKFAYMNTSAQEWR